MHNNNVIAIKARQAVFIRNVFLCLLPVLVAGCEKNKENPVAAFYYLTTQKDLQDIGRVVLIELANDSAYPRVSKDVTDSLYGALQKRQVFGLTVIRPTDAVWHNLQLDKFSDYSYQQLADIRKALKADAILRGTITRYEPFPHLKLGLRLELIDLSNAQLLWALEQIWDAADKATQDKIRNYYKTALFPWSEDLNVDMGSVSSLKFIDFVTWEVGKTIKPTVK